MTIFDTVFVPREDLIMGRLGPRHVVDAAVEARKMKLIDEGADPDTIRVAQAWNSVDGMSISIAWQKLAERLPTAEEKAEWMPR